MKQAYDAIVVGSGPNGLAAAIRLAQAGVAVLVVEANDTIGGSVRSAELTLPGFIHDICSAVHPLAVASPFFGQLPLHEHGLHWIHPELPLAHLLDGRAVLLHQSLTESLWELGDDADAYRKLFGPLLDHWNKLKQEILRPPLHLPQYPVSLVSFGFRAMQSAKRLADRNFKSVPARALFAGLAAHSFLPLDATASSAFGIVLALAGHAEGWPSPAGGAQQLTEALASYFRSLGGEIQIQWKVHRLEDLPAHSAVLLDLTSWKAASLCKSEFPISYQRRLENFPHGPGVFKMDFALNQPIPWRSEACRRAGTVHLGGTLEEIAESESEVAKKMPPTKPFVILAQPSLFDHRRAPPGKHTAWAYCHVPNGSSFEMAERIEQQIERYAPGFRDCVLAKNATNCVMLEQKNANLVGGSINGGASDFWHLLARPVLSHCPYRTPVKGIYLCSSSTPPGGGVHGMCGFHAAEAAIRDLFS